MSTDGSPPGTRVLHPAHQRLRVQDIVGNVLNARLREVIERHWSSIAAQKAAGEPLVELAGYSR